MHQSDQLPDDLFDDNFAIDLPEVKIPEGLVYDVAMGMEEPQVIAARYGVTDGKWKALENWTPFLNAVNAQRAEFEVSGYTFKLQAKLLTAKVFEKAWATAMMSDTPLTQKLEFIKVGAKLAGLEQPIERQVATQSATPTFSININIPNAGPSTQIIDVG